MVIETLNQTTQVVISPVIGDIFEWAGRMALEAVSAAFVFFGAARIESGRIKQFLWVVGGVLVALAAMELFFISNTLSRL